MRLTANYLDCSPNLIAAHEKRGGIAFLNQKSTKFGAAKWSVSGKNCPNALRAACLRGVALRARHVPIKAKPHPSVAEVFSLSMHSPLEDYFARHSMSGSVVVWRRVREVLAVFVMF